MPRKTPNKETHTDAALLSFFRAIALNEAERVCQLLAASPDLARQAIHVGATRQHAVDYFLQEIEHHIYAGDTALHVAARAYQASIARQLIAKDADPRARNRRGAEPLHYAAEGGPGSHTWNPEGHAAIIAYLIEAGADPNAADKGGVTPLHRAVRTRCAAAVRALLANGADPRRKNKSGSTPLHLAVQTTGRGGTGSCLAQEQQKQIIQLLLRRGGQTKDKNGQGKTVLQSIGSGWLRELLQDE